MTTEQEAPRIIVVDDSDDDFLLIKRQLINTWHTAIVRHAHSEETLRTALDDIEPDLVICDYSMPQMTHERAIEMVQALRPDTPMILLSGLASEALGVQAMHEGVRDYIEKSKPERLIPAVRREIHTHRLRREKLLLEQAHRRAVYFDTATGFLNREGLVKTLSGLSTNSDNENDLCLLSVNVSRNQSRRPEVDPRIRRNMLEKIAERVRETFKQDILCRWSDNVLVVLTNRLDWNANRAVIADTLCELEASLNRVFTIYNIAVRPNMRLGLARPGVHGRHAAELVTHAQSVAHVIESRGLELLDVLDNEVHELAKRRKTIELGLAKGIESNELVLDFQPIEDLKTGRICGVEALVRWTHPDLGRIMPSEFIDVAEDSGLIDALGDWVIESSSKKVLALHQQGHMLWCAVNCSTGQLLNPEFPAKAHQTIRNAGLDPKWIEFEVTESAAIDDMGRTVEALKKLKSEGSPIAMDDFGTGYASLNYLRQLPVDVLKIDKSFVMDLLENNNSHMIVKAVIDLAHALGLVVHAEGIESAEQRDSLIQLGCDRLQGYWLCHPLDMESLSKWLNETKKARLNSNG
ncbi:MAG: EAL domain-containing protein [Burkholderiales bacterium]|jgi:EAL domain-containing protein (putative c-di-GMP-specific phosphodiesterase class I)/FixJ family two-component response regulator|uniref:putative bifunctional diguanylate cyclase/phosphodiesterase n=1 Tax=Limnobacter sp. TaxID=2003368 RepID=UPI0039BD90CB|nr:EAL domain-containing protein [Burkholderiales bacterium]